LEDLMDHLTAPLRRIILAATLSLAALPSMAETMKDVFPSYADWLDPSDAERFAALEVHRGAQTMAGGEYTLQLGEGYYALTGDDARWVMETLWQNLPQPELQGLIFQTGTSPLDDSWASTVYYFENGHISDDEAATMDYAAIIQSLKDSDADQNRQRREAGLPEITTIGLAGTPGYDQTARALKFSVLLKQAANDNELLNANAWILSRHGFVNLNVLGSAGQAGEVDAKMPELIGLVAMGEGNKYEDFTPGVDTVAEGGLSGLLGGGAAQVGMLVVALALLKKGGVIVLLAGAWIVKKIRGNRAKT
jgi:uncharacterized membrane-anchored protein